VAEPAVPHHDTSEIPPVKPRRRPGRTIFRVLAWVLPILVVLAIAFLAVGWYARNTYYVGVDRGRVTLFQGVKGGLLVWNPTIESLTGTQRRNAELGLGLLAVIITVGGYILVALSKGPSLPPNLWFFLAVLIGLYVVAHLAVRRLAPRADGALLPLAALLNGIGFVFITRIDRDAQNQLAPSQAVWTMVGVAAFIGTLLLVRRVHLLERYRYTFLFLGLFALLLPLAPGLGREINGARLWVRLGPVNFQPGELAKVFLVIFLAGYLVDKREVLAAGGRRI